MKLGRCVHLMVLQKRYAGTVKILIVRPVAPHSMLKIAKIKNFEQSGPCNRQKNQNSHTSCITFLLDHEVNAPVEFHNFRLSRFSNARPLMWKFSTFRLIFLKKWLCRVMYRQPSRGERQMSPFWKLDNQGYNMCEKERNLKFWPGPPPPVALILV